MSGKGALSGVRVVEFASPLVSYCGKLFADLGAEVVLVEPPQGSRERSEAPFIDDRPAPEGSLTFAYFHCGKKSITLDTENPADVDLARRLLCDADLFLEGTQPGTLSASGLDYRTLHVLNPKLVYTSITAFGQDGPYARFAYSDLTLLALGGLLYLGGYADGPPVRVYGNQALQSASLFGAVGAISALYAAAAGGDGEHVDVSAQECVALALENSIQMYELEGVVRRRYGGEQRQAGTGVFPSRDGYICMMAAGIASNRFWRNTVEWLCEEGVPGAQALQDPQWSDLDYLNTAEAKSRFAEIFLPFARSRTSAYLYEAGQRHRLPICPVCSPAELLGNRQLLAREYFVQSVHGATGRSLTMPGAPYKLAATPWRLQGGPPRLGEHGAEIRARYAPGRAGLAAAAGGVASR